MPAKRLYLDKLLLDAHAWHVNPDHISPPALHEHCSSWLSKTEQSHYAALRAPELRHRYLTGRALGRLSLSEYAAVDPAEWRFAENEFGKPQIAEPSAFKSLQFNIAHTEGMVVCLLSRAGEVGVDVEKISRTADIDLIARNFLSEPERASLTVLPQPERNVRFFKLWVLKEACLKGMGRGLGSGEERFTIGLDGNGEPASIDGWHFTLHHPSKDHIAATAIRSQHAPGSLPVQWLSAGTLFETRIPVVRGRIPEPGLT